MSVQEAGAQAVAGAMLATLPGIDANDPRKTLACFRFYSVVLSSVGTLQVSLPDSSGCCWRHSAQTYLCVMGTSVVFILWLHGIGYVGSLICWLRLHTLLQIKGGIRNTHSLLFFWPCSGAAMQETQDHVQL